MKTFKYTLFISFIVACLILISKFNFDILTIIIVLVGCFLASLFPYIDYLVLAFYIHPDNQSAYTIKSLFLRREFLKLIAFIDESNLTEFRPTINSAHFQVILIVLGFYFLTTSPLLFGFSFLLSLMFNLVYRLHISIPFYAHWFWLFKNPVGLRFVRVWVYVNLGLALLYIALV